MWQSFLDSLHSEGGYIFILLLCLATSCFLFISVAIPGEKDFFRGVAHEFTGALFILITTRLKIGQGDNAPKG